MKGLQYTTTTDVQPPPKHPKKGNSKLQANGKLAKIEATKEQTKEIFGQAVHDSDSDTDQKGSRKLTKLLFLLAL